MRRRTHNIATFTLPQLEFWTTCQRERRIAYVGGIGAGKTFAGCVQLLNTKEDSTTMVLSPTYAQMRDSSFKLFQEIYGDSGLIESHNKTEMETRLAGNRTVLWRSADRPDRLRGSNLNYAWLDEASFMEESLVNVVLGRLRREPGKIWLTFTPRGKSNWTYRTIQSGLFKMVHAPTSSNKFNPEHFIEGLKLAYSGSHAAQELDGLFVDTDGALFRSTWFKPWEGEPPQKVIVCRAWDAAATREGGDYSVGLLMGLIPGTNKVVILDIIRQQYGADMIDPQITRASDQDGKETTVVLEQEPGSAGKRLIQHQLQQLAGKRCAWYSPGQNKLTRAVPVARAAAAGEVYYLPGKPWIPAFFEEIDQFTGTSADTHDDQVDALSLAYNHLTGRIRKMVAA